jgi:hypothetical protein
MGEICCQGTKIPYSASHSQKTEGKKEVKAKNKAVDKNESTKTNSPSKTKQPKKEIVEKTVKYNEKISIIELSEEKKAIKKMLKKAKKINKMIFVYIFLVISVLAIIVMINNKLHTITCEVNNNSETEKYSIKLILKRNGKNITGFKYITENITNSYDETLKSRYDIIINDLMRKENFDEIVSSKLKNRSLKIVYDFNENNLDKTSQYIGIDLEPYYEDVDILVKELEKEVGFSCK